MYILSNDQGISQFLGYLKQLIQALPWRVTGFAQYPSGVTEMLSVLDNPEMEGSYKLWKISHIVNEQYAKSSAFRAKETHFFYGALKYFLNNDGHRMFPDIGLDQWKGAFKAVLDDTQEGRLLSAILEELDTLRSDYPKLEVPLAFETSAFAIHLAMCHYPFNLEQLQYLERRERAIREGQEESSEYNAWVSPYLSNRKLIKQHLDLANAPLESLLKMGMSGDDIYFYLKRSKEGGAYLSNNGFNVEVLLLCMHAKIPLSEELKSKGMSALIEKACQSSVVLTDEFREKTKSYLKEARDLNFELSEKDLEKLKFLQVFVNKGWDVPPSEKAEVSELLVHLLYNHGWASRGAMVMFRKDYRNKR
ncbi:MAG: hypothetical protein K0Q57_1202, partial [Gammaproteobacteria bacterium]|nr:hypothetical protein [Gammaproteobacteria bacterium]